MRFLTHFHGSKQPLIIETTSFHVLDARDEITKIIGKKPTSMRRLDDIEDTLNEFLSESAPENFSKNLM